MYKVIDCEFRGYRRIIFHNTLKAHFFYVFGPDFDHLYDCPYAEIIAVVEQYKSKFYSLEDCVEDSMRIIELRCGYTGKEVPMRELCHYTTHEISQKDVMCWKKGEIYG